MRHRHVTASLRRSISRNTCRALPAIYPLSFFVYLIYAPFLCFHGFSCSRLFCTRARRHELQIAATSVRYMKRGAVTSVFLFKYRKRTVVQWIESLPFGRASPRRKGFLFLAAPLRSMASPESRWDRAPKADDDGRTVTTIKKNNKKMDAKKVSGDRNLHPRGSRVKEAAER